MIKNNDIDLVQILKTATILPGFSNYLITSTGHVYSMVTGMLKEIGAVSKGRYRMVHLHDDNGKQVTKWVHRLTWEAFNGRIPKHLQICHIDDNRFNNDLSNLMLGTAKVNCNMGDRNRKISIGLKKYWKEKKEAMQATLEHEAQHALA